MSLLKRFRRPRTPITLEEDPYGYKDNKYKVRFSLVGSVNVGKSSLAAALVLTAKTMSSMMENFYCRVLNKNSNIMRDSNNLVQGRFPPKTDPLLPVAPEAGLLIGERRGRLFGGDTYLHIPICDVGGEIMDAISGVVPGQREYVENINRHVINHIRDSDGFILVLAATDAQFFRQGYQFMDADSYIYSVFHEIMEHKKRNRGTIKTVAVWLTKWDEAMEDARDIGMDIYANQEGMDRFMDNGFPGISMLLKPLRDQGKVQYFRSYFKLQKREDGLTNAQWEDGRPRIRILEDPNHYIRFKPDFSGDECVRFIKWAASFAQ